MTATPVDAGPVLDGQVVDAGLPLAAQVSQIVRMRCSFARCHGGITRGEASLNFERALSESGSAMSALVGVPACEYDAWARVEPYHPERSWLITKLEGHADAQGWLQFEPAATWDAGLATDAQGKLPASLCPRTLAGELTFGQLMPLSGDASKPLEPHEVDLFRRWILAGAPSD